MYISDYIDLVLSTKKDNFLNIEIDVYFDKSELKKLCDLSIPEVRLKIAWGTVIDCLSDNYYDSVQEFLTDDILEFLIDNNICLSDLGHLCLPENYLQQIYDKDNRCWEALENIKRFYRN